MTTTVTFRGCCCECEAMSFQFRSGTLHFSCVMTFQRLLSTTRGHICCWVSLRRSPDGILCSMGWVFVSAPAQIKERSQARPLPAQHPYAINCQDTDTRRDSPPTMRGVFEVLAVGVLIAPALSDGIGYCSWSVSNPDGNSTCDGYVKYKWEGVFLRLDVITHNSRPPPHRWQHLSAHSRRQMEAHTPSPVNRITPP
jgi:hypothetical protein